MVVVIRKEVRDAVGIGKSAVLVKWNRQWAVSGSYEHCPASACIMPEKILYQFLPVSPTLELRINGNVLYLKNIFCFAGDDTGCSDTAVLGQHEHFTAFQIMVYHGFLFIGQKQQVEVLFLIMEHRLYTYHFIAV